MYFLAVNGSARKKGNTALLLEQALAGAASKGADTELVHLYDLNYKGCTSCYACKLKEGPSYGKCAMRDELTPLLEKFAAADAVFLGSPIYFGNLSGEMRSFLERLMFPILVYKKISPPTLVTKKIQVGLIYTMNMADEIRQKMEMEERLNITEIAMAMLFGQAEPYFCYDTYQFDDYSQYVSERFDPVAKAERREQVFPKDCEHVYQMGARFAGIL